jgi:hypothetical protein
MQQGHSVASEDSSRAGDGLSSDLIQQCLVEIFQSAPFRASKQSQQLLRYIVDHSLSGHSELLKERLIGVNVFRRRPDYDTNEDPIVRARAAEVRKRLAQFYLGEGSRASIRIEVAPGSYHASFAELREKAASDATPPPSASPEVSPKEPALAPTSVETSDAEGSSGPKHRIALGSLLGLALLCFAAFFWSLERPDTPIDRFWKPYFGSSNPIVLYSGANAVYMLSARFVDHYKATHHLDALENQGREFAVPISSGMKLGSEDLVPFTNDFITIGDLSANVRIASLLAQRHKRLDVRCGEDVAFSDLRQSPAILIGAFNNSWTMELTGDLPIIFQHSGTMTIRDQANRTQVWTPTFTSDQKIAVDYAVVTRMPHSRTGQVLVTIAGMTQAGTHAAADFITDPEQLKKLSATVPNDWDQKNLEFVLQTKVVNNIPTAPVIVATRSW